MNWISRWKKIGIKVKQIFKKQPTGQEETDWKNCPQCKKISYLDDGDFCLLYKEKVEFYNSKKNKINKEIFELSDEDNVADKGDYKDFMSKEINEQSVTTKTVSYTHLTLPTNREV